MRIAADRRIFAASFIAKVDIQIFSLPINSVVSRKFWSEYKWIDLCLVYLIVALPFLYRRSGS